MPAHSRFQSLDLLATLVAVVASDGAVLYANAALEDALTLERDLQRELGYSDDYREGVDAFRNKRPPKFTGK